MSAESPKSFRLQFRFWLDIVRPDEHWLAEKIEGWKAARQFAGVIRDALRLFAMLQAGDVSVLRALFPEIVRTIEAEHHSAELNRVTAELERLHGEMAALIAGGNHTKPARRVDDAPPPEIVITKAPVGNAGKNFMASLMGIRPGGKV